MSIKYVKLALLTCVELKSYKNQVIDFSSQSLREVIPSKGLLNEVVRVYSEGAKVHIMR